MRNLISPTTPPSRWIPSLCRLGRKSSPPHCHPDSLAYSAMPFRMTGAAMLHASSMATRFRQISIIPGCAPVIDDRRARFRQIDRRPCGGEALARMATTRAVRDARCHPAHRSRYSIDSGGRGGGSCLRCRYVRRRREAEAQCWPERECLAGKAQSAERSVQCRPCRMRHAGSRRSLRDLRARARSRARLMDRIVLLVRRFDRASFALRGS